MQVIRKLNHNFYNTHTSLITLQVSTFKGSLGNKKNKVIKGKCCSGSDKQIYHLHIHYDPCEQSILLTAILNTLLLYAFSKKTNYY